MPSEREKIIAEIEKKAITLARLLVQKRVRETAVEDFMRRGFTAFADEHLDALSGRQWADRLVPNATHLFHGQGGQEGGPAPTSAGPIVLTPEQQKLPPQERMTIAREKQAQLEAVRAAGGQV